MKECKVHAVLSNRIRETWPPNYVRGPQVLEPMWRAGTRPFKQV
jgi:hypothetical protein